MSIVFFIVEQVLDNNVGNYNHLSHLPPSFFFSIFYFGFKKDSLNFWLFDLTLRNFIDKKGINNYNHHYICSEKLKTQN